jgi:hypothetical protein
MAEKIGEVSVGVEPQTKAQLEALARYHQIDAAYSAFKKERGL